MNTFFDNELLRELNVYILNGDIEVLNEEKAINYFDVLSHLYPLSFNTIEWAKVDYLFFAKCDSMEKGNEIMASLLLLIDEEYSSLIKNLDIIILGDLMDYAYKMPFSFFKDNWYVFFELPQNTYIYIESIKKCIHHTTFREIFFG